MKKLCLTVLMVLLLTGVVDAGLQGTAWRDSLGTYYRGFHSGWLYSSDNGVDWIGMPWLWMYVDLNGLFFTFTNPIGLLLGNIVVEIGTYSMQDTTGSMSITSYYLYLLTPVVKTFNLVLIDDDWIPPEGSGLGQKDEMDMHRYTDAFTSDMFLKP